MNHVKDINMENKQWKFKDVIVKVMGQPVKIVPIELEDMEQPTTEVDITSCKFCSTEGCCPFSFTDASEQAQNYGCLPSPMEIVNMRVKHGKSWACHSNEKKPCLGAINYLKEKGLPFKVIDKKLITQDSDYLQYIK